MNKGADEWPLFPHRFLGNSVNTTLIDFFFVFIIYMSHKIFISNFYRRIHINIEY